MSAAIDSRVVNYARAAEGSPTDEYGLPARVVVDNFMPIKDSDRIGLRYTVEFHAKDHIEAMEQAICFIGRHKSRVDECRYALLRRAAALDLSERNEMTGHIEGFLPRACRYVLWLLLNLSRWVVLLY